MKLNYFNYSALGEKILITNDLGNYMFIDEPTFKRLLSLQIDDSCLKAELIDKGFIFDDTEIDFSSKYRYEMRKQKSHVITATSLHIFVVTTACNMACVYCQANNGKAKPCGYMSYKTAERAVEIALSSPAKSLNFEFQGGEPLLNFDIIRYIVEYAESHKKDKEIVYNIVSNLTLLNDEILDFFVEHNFSVSTSLDGDELIHNKNRKYASGGGTYSDVIEGINRIRQARLFVGAIETTSRETLKYPKELVHAYCDQGFDTIFIRPLTPLGKADFNWTDIGYSAEEYLDFYKQALDEIIKINKKGKVFKENHLNILLERISGNPINYMELRSPCGAGIGQLAYYTDGNVFTCDEARMLYEMGDSAFKLGNVYENTYSEIIANGVCKTACAASILETLPSCCDCVYQPFCGTCPVVTYSLYGDVIEKSPHGYRCKIYKGMLDYIFSKIADEYSEEAIVLKSWGI